MYTALSQDQWADTLVLEQYDHIAANHVFKSYCEDLEEIERGNT